MQRLRVLPLAFAAGCSFGADLPAIRDAASDGPDAQTAPACVEARCRHKTITIDHAKVVGGPHATFPVFVRIADADFANAQASGGDFAFVTADAPAVILAAERERFADNELTAWVAVPALSSTTDTVLYLYYGDPAAADTQNRAAVWDADFQAVWHLSETTGGTNALKDSTARANSGTDIGVTLGVPGKLGAAARFDGVDDHIRVPSSSAFTPVYMKATLSMWASWTQPVSNDYQRLLLATNSLAGDARGFEWASNPQGGYYYYPANAGSMNYAAIATPFTANTWHHVAVTQDFAAKSVTLYVDGTARPAVVDMTPVLWTQVMTAADWHWGGTATRNRFAGMMDEIHVSKSVRSAGWIATEYANQSDPATFYRVE